MILLRIAIRHSAYLRKLRHWETLEVTQTEEHFWLRGIQEAQLKSTPLRTLPFAETLRLENDLLFPLVGELPLGKAPQLRDWQAITTAFPMRKPSLNHNYFGLQTQLSLQLEPSEAKQNPHALICEVSHLNQLLRETSAFRLRNLRWTLSPKRKALIVGTPLLPLPGATFWLQGQVLVPTGYRLNPASLLPFWKVQHQLNASRQLVLEDEKTLFYVDAATLLPLSLSSVQRTSHPLNPNS